MSAIVLPAKNDIGWTDVLNTAVLAASTSSAAIRQSFVIAATTWEITHNLGFPPFVTLYSSAGEVISGDITANTGVLTRVEFFYPITGSMTLL